MKFKCTTSYERHRKKVDRCQHWHPWFAWRPVRVQEGYCVWLEHIWRRGDYYLGWTDGYWEWQYQHRRPITEFEPRDEE